MKSKTYMISIYVRLKVAYFDGEHYKGDDIQIRLITCYTVG